MSRVIRLDSLLIIAIMTVYTVLFESLDRRVLYQPTGVTDDIRILIAITFAVRNYFFQTIHAQLKC